VTRIVVARPLDEEGFRPFGRAIEIPAEPAVKRGEDWDCWFALASLGSCSPGVGAVVTRPTQAAVTAMEREPASELLLPVTGAVVQAVGLPGEEPDAETVEAFVVEPGQAIVMAPGTWHCAARPVTGEALYYFVTEPTPLEPGQSPWVPFRGGKAVSVRLHA
jgi:ureidoglycolate hydrolase